MRHLRRRGRLEGLLRGSILREPRLSGLERLLRRGRLEGLGLLAGEACELRLQLGLRWSLRLLSREAGILALKRLSCKARGLRSEVARLLLERLLLAVGCLAGSSAVSAAEIGARARKHGEQGTPSAQMQ